MSVFTNEKALIIVVCIPLITGPNGGGRACLWMLTARATAHLAGDQRGLPEGRVL